MKLLLISIISLLNIAFSYEVEILSTPFLGGAVYKPINVKTSKGVILLHGSEGGNVMFTHVEAIYYASNGITAFSYCYLDCKSDITSKRDVLINIDVEKLVEAIKWFKKSNTTKVDKVILYGFSRGAELASLVATLDDSTSDKLIDALAIHSGTDVVEAPWSWDWKDERCWLCVDMKKCDQKQWSPICGDKPKSYGDYNQEVVWFLKERKFRMGDKINLGNFKGKVFATHGKADDVWSYTRTENLMKTLPNSSYVIKEIFEAQGHVFSPSATNLRRKNFLEFTRNL